MALIAAVADNLRRDGRERNFGEEEKKVTSAVGADMGVPRVSDGKEKRRGAVCWLLGLVLGRAAARALRRKCWAGLGWARGCAGLFFF